MPTRKGSDNRFPLVRVVEDVIDSDPTPAGEIHLRADEATSQLYTVDDAGVVKMWGVGLHDHTGALDGGDLDAAVVDGYIVFNEESAPGTADSGTVRAYAKVDGHLYIKDDAGTEYDLTGGGTFDLDDVGDVNAPSPANGDVLTWDSTPGEWVAAAPAGGSTLTQVPQYIGVSAASGHLTPVVVALGSGTLTAKIRVNQTGSAVFLNLFKNGSRIEQLTSSAGTNTHTFSTDSATAGDQYYIAMSNGGAATPVLLADAFNLSAGLMILGGPSVGVHALV